MNYGHSLLKAFSTIGLILTLGINMNADAGILGFGGTSWKEEVLLHDGSKIVVTRAVERGGRHEIGQKSAYKEQSLTFSLPATGQRVTWEDHHSENLGSANFLPMLIDISGGITYLVVSPMGCLSYNKWGRPNPPYVVFKHQDKEWKRIPLQELPAEIKTPNLIFSAPDIEVKKIGKNFVTSEMIQEIANSLTQPEYKTILRVPLANGGHSCPEMVRINGGWSSPGGAKSPIPISPVRADEKNRR